MQIPDASMLVVLGRTRIAGSMLFGNATEGTLYRHMAHCSGPIDGFEEYYLSRNPVTVEPDGSVSSPPYARASGSFAFLYSRLGEATETTFPQMISAFPDFYTAAHRGDRIAQTLSRFVAPTVEDYLKIFPNGKPDTDVLLRGEREVYDPRIDDYQWTDNGPLCVLHFLLMPAWKGWGLAPALFDMDDIADTANAADVIMADGEQRSWCSGVYSCDRPRGEVLADILLSTGTQIVRLDNGKMSIRLIDDNPTSDMIIPERAVQEFEWSAGPESVERPNRVTLKFFPEQQHYNITELQLDGLRWGLDQDEIDRVGERLDEITLNFCQWTGQASRIARRLWYTRRAARGQVVTNLYGLGALGRNYATIPFIGIDQTLKVAIMEPRLEADGVSVSIPFAAVPTLPTYNPALDKAPVPDTLPVSGYISDIIAPEIVSAGIVATGAGAATGNEVRVTINPLGGASIEAVYRHYAATPGLYVSMAKNGAGTFAWDAGGTLGNQADFRARTIVDNEVSEFSDTLHIAALAYNNTPLGQPSVSPSDMTNTFAATVSTSFMNAAWFRAEKRDDLGGSFGPWTSFDLGDIRPGQIHNIATVFLVPSGTSVEIRVSLMTSNNTIGTYSTIAYSIP